MSIKKTKEGFKITCDSCGFNEEMDTDGEMGAFKEIMRELGWHLGRRHRDICADCKAENKK